MQVLDWLVVGFYLGIVAAIGLWNARGQKDSEDYFLAGRRIPWWAAGLSILATECSALTFLGAPTQSLRGDWTYLQLAIGSIAARFIVAGLLIGVYYRARVSTIYLYLGQRFGRLTQNIAVVLFFFGRLLGSGVRLFGAAIGLVIILDIAFPLAIVLIAVVALLYSITGGIRSVIWTDTLQGVLLIAGGVITAFYVLLYHDGGLASVWQLLAQGTTADGHAKLRIIDLGLSSNSFLGIEWDKSYTLVAGIVGSCFLTMSTHGTDQDMVQRALTCKSERDGRKSLWLSAVLTLPVVMLFLTVGSLLWVHIGGNEEVAKLAARLAAERGESNPARGYDFVFSWFIQTQLPVGVKGLILAALFAAAMSSLDSAVTALSSTAVDCVWRPYVQPGRDDRYYLVIARWISAGFGILLVLVALLTWIYSSAGSEREGFGVLMLGLKAPSWFFPPLLGIFLLAVLTKRGNDVGNVIAVSVGIATLLVVEFWDGLFRPVGQVESLLPPFAWVWNAMIGCTLTFSVAFLFAAKETGAATISHEDSA